jgi:hypothetical protein
MVRNTINVNKLTHDKLKSIIVKLNGEITITELIGELVDNYYNNMTKDNVTEELRKSKTREIQKIQDEIEEIGLKKEFKIKQIKQVIDETN